MAISADLKTLLQAIRDNQYHDGHGPLSPVWTSSVEHGFNRQKVGGLFSAGSRAGLLDTTEEGADSTCWLTEAGLKAANE